MDRFTIQKADASIGPLVNNDMRNGVRREINGALFQRHAFSGNLDLRLDRVGKLGGKGSDEAAIKAVTGTFEAGLANLKKLAEK